MEAHKGHDGSLVRVSLHFHAKLEECGRLCLGFFSPGPCFAGEAGGSECAASAARTKKCRIQGFPITYEVGPRVVVSILIPGKSWNQQGGMGSRIDSVCDTLPRGVASSKEAAIAHVPLTAGHKPMFEGCFAPMLR